MIKIERLKDVSIPVMGVLEDSVVDGEGLRFALFVQGCPHHCKGCHNPQSWDMTNNNLLTLYEIYRKVADNPLCEGITFSGGEPFLYTRQLRMLAEAIHNLGKTVWAYTGWVLEELILRKDAVALLDNVDVLVDGEFKIENRDRSLMFRGSSNQRVIDIKETCRKGSIALKYPDEKISHMAS